MRSFSIALLAVVPVIAMIGAPGVCEVTDEIVIWGDDTDKPPAKCAAYDPTSAEIKTDACVFFKIRTPAAGYTVAQRERIIQKRIIEIFDTGKIGPVYVNAIRGRPTIYVGKVRLVTVYPADVAALADCDDPPDARALANIWARGVRRGLLRTAPSSCFDGPPPYTVALGNTVLFRLADATGYANLLCRGEAVEKKVALIATATEPAEVQLAPTTGGVAVNYKGNPVVTATEIDARARGYASAQELSSAWATNLAGLMEANKALRIADAHTRE